MKGFLYWSAYNNIVETMHMDAAPGRIMNGDGNACGNSLACASRDAKADPALFVQCARQFLSTAGARTCSVTCSDYQEDTLGFETRRCGDYLYVTRSDDERLKPGMRIVAVGRNTVPFLLKDTGQDIFWGRGTDREAWDLVMRMFDDVDVFPGDGHVERLSLKRLPLTHAQPQPACAISEPAEGVALFDVRSLTDANALHSAFAAASGLLGRAHGLVLDLRACAGEADPAAYLELLPLLADSNMPAREVMGDVRLYTIYSKNNVARLLGRLEAARKALEGHEGTDDQVALIEELERDIQSKGKQVLEAKRAVTGMAKRREVGELPETAPSPFTDELVGVAEHAPARVVVLVGERTGAGAERLAQSVMGMQKVQLVGRATPGAVDYANYVSAEYADINARFTFPISRTKANREGRGYALTGLPLDVHVPFTAEECTRDVVLARGIEVLA